MRKYLLLCLAFLSLEAVAKISASTAVPVWHGSPKRQGYTRLGQG